MRSLVFEACLEIAATARSRIWRSDGVMAGCYAPIRHLGDARWHRQMTRLRELPDEKPAVHAVAGHLDDAGVGPESLMRPLPIRVGVDQWPRCPRDRLADPHVGAA